MVMTTCVIARRIRLVAFVYMTSKLATQDEMLATMSKFRAFMLHPPDSGRYFTMSSSSCAYVCQPAQAAKVEHTIY